MLIKWNVDALLNYYIEIMTPILTFTKRKEGWKKIIILKLIVLEERYAYLFSTNRWKIIRIS